MLTQDYIDESLDLIEDPDAECDTNTFHFLALCIHAAGVLKQVPAVVKVAALMPADDVAHASRAS